MPQQDETGTVDLNGKDESELAAVLRAAIAGDEKAYAAFLERTASLVRGYARRKIHSRVDPEDIVQETLLAIHLKRHTWFNDAPVLPWIFAIARYKLIDAFRRRGRAIEIDIDEIVETFVQPVAEGVSAHDIGHVLETLTTGQRNVVAAISVEGCTISETAKRLGISEAAVRVSLHRGLRAIAKRFGQS